MLTSSRMAAACWVVSFLESCMVTCTQAEVEVGNVTENRVDVYLPEYAQNGETNGRGIIGSLIYQWSYILLQVLQRGQIPLLVGG